MQILIHLVWMGPESLLFFFFLAALGLRCRKKLSLVVVAEATVVAVSGLLTAAASLVAEHWP